MARSLLERDGQRREAILLSVWDAEGVMLQRIITQPDKPRGYGGLLVTIEDDSTGEHHSIAFSQMGWVGTLNSENGLGWTGVEHGGLSLAELIEVHRMIGEYLVAQ